MINTKLIRSKMTEQNVTYEEIGKAIGKETVTVRQKITNVRPMFLAEAEVIQKLLHIPDREFRLYFFAGDHPDHAAG